jgi:hypothetical protein
LQIDRFDSIIIEAFAQRVVRVAVYDNDPGQDYLRFEKSFAVPGTPSAAAQRFASLRVSPPGRER